MRYILSILILFYATTSSFAEPLSLNEVMEAVCRINSGGGWGTGTCIAENEDEYFILTNAHVVGRASTVNVEFFKWGYKTKPLPAKVTWRRLQGSLDAAIIRVNKSHFGNYGPRIIPLAPEGSRISSNDYIMAAGCPSARWVQGWEGRIIQNEQSRIVFGPPPIGGQSGTGITVLIKDSNGEYHTRVGVLLAWKIGGNRGAGVSLSALYSAFNGRNNFDPLPDGYLPISTNKSEPVKHSPICAVCNKCANCHIRDDDGILRCNTDVNVQDTACSPGGCAPGGGSSPFRGGGRRPPGGGGNVPPLGPGDNPFTERPPSDGGGRNPFGGNIRNPFGDKPAPPGGANPDGAPWPGGGNTRPDGPTNPNLPGSDKVKKLEARIIELEKIQSDLTKEKSVLTADKVKLAESIGKLQAGIATYEAGLAELKKTNSDQLTTITDWEQKHSNLNGLLDIANNTLANKQHELAEISTILVKQGQNLQIARGDLKIQVGITNSLEQELIHPMDGMTAGNGETMERTAFITGGSMLTLGLLFLWRRFVRKRVDARLEGAIDRIGNKLGDHFGGRVVDRLGDLKDRGLDSVEDRIRDRGHDDGDDDTDEHQRPLQRIRKRRQARKARRRRDDGFESDTYDHSDFRNPPVLPENPVMWGPSVPPKLYPQSQYGYSAPMEHVPPVPFTPTSYPDGLGPVPVGVPSFQTYSYEDVLRAVDEVARRNSGNISLRSIPTLVRQVLNAPKRV